MGRERNRPARRGGANETTLLRGLSILRWAHGGEGVAIPDDGPLAQRVIFVPDVVPGDVVDLAIVEARDRWARGKVIAREDSPERVPVPCAVQDRCGGCPWMPGSARAQAESRERILRGELKKRLGYDGPVTLLEAPSRFGYRQRLRLTFDEAGLGFLGKKSHTLVDIARCEVADERINQILPSVRDRLPRGREGRVTLLVGEDGVAGIIDDGASVTAFGPESVTLRFGDYTQRLAPGAFAQANADVTGQMLTTIARWAGPATAEDVAVELFAGAGTLTMALWRNGWRVHAYEVADARAAFEATRAAMHGEGEWHASDLSIGVPLPAPPVPSLILLDPPRTGAAEVMPWVSAAGARTTIYVSCDLATGLRDLAMLSGYRLEEVVGLDMFPHAGHQEVMFLLRRAPAG